ncbi:MAG: SWIM zinc finger family protein [Nocardioidaceae bacterium]
MRGTSWWGLAWVDAMEETSLDMGRLARGRTYANAGRVGAIVVTPGRIQAHVQGSRRVPYRSTVTVRRLDDDARERFLDEVSSRAGHLAALLDKDMPHDLVEAAAAVGVPLLPQVGDLTPHRTCPDSGYPCKHAAALCYQAAWLLDEDPFVLLLMRGRGDDDLLEELTRRNADQRHPSSPGVRRDRGGVAVETRARPPISRNRGVVADAFSRDRIPWSETLSAWRSRRLLPQRRRLSRP